MAISRLTFLVLVFAATAGARAESILVNAELTDAGRKAERPTREKPQYYVPMTYGFREEGDVIGGEKVPDPQKVLRSLKTALTKEGYLFSGDEKVAPSLFLVFEWGSMNPVERSFDFGTYGDGKGFQEGTGDDSQQGLPDPAVSHTFNRREMLSLVFGPSLENPEIYSQDEREALVSEAESGRYFVVVSAFDFESVKTKKPVLLWRTRISVSRDRLDFGDVYERMIATGAARFGREAAKTARVVYPRTKTTEVKIGEAVPIDNAPPVKK